MKPATDLREFFRIMNPGTYLKMEDKDFYVSIYDQITAEIRLELEELSTPNVTIYVSGQPGSGKTTALNFLPDAELEEEFIVELLYGADLFDLEDLEIVDILLLLSNTLVRDYPELQKLFSEKLNRIVKTLQGRYQEVATKQEDEQTSKGVGIKGWLRGNPFAAFFNIIGVEANAFADYKLNYEKRRLVREVFTPSITDLLELTNEVIEKFLEKKDPTGKKQLLLVFHELNHIKDLENINKLFVRNRFYLEGIKARKVITIPVSLEPDPSFNPNPKPRFLGLKTRHSPLEDDEENNELSNKNRDLLRSVVTKRIAEKGGILSSEALEFAIDQSGGNVRQLVSILYYAARKVRTLRGEHISLSDAMDGAKVVRRDLERSLISSDKIKLLDYIRRNAVPAGSDDPALFRECLLSNQVFIYQNGKTWYALNPLIEDTVKLYAERFRAEQQEDEEI